MSVYLRGISIAKARWHPIPVAIIHSLQPSNYGYLYFFVKVSSGNFWDVYFYKIYFHFYWRNFTNSLHLFVASASTSATFCLCVHVELFKEYKQTESNAFEISILPFSPVKAFLFLLSEHFDHFIWNGRNIEHFSFEIFASFISTKFLLCHCKYQKISEVQYKTRRT